MEVCIRKVSLGDEGQLAYIQIESWKAAFGDILDQATLDQYTEFKRIEDMYRQLLEEHTGNGYILELDHQAHCMAWWDQARDSDKLGKAELICLHSLPNNWGKGYGSLMMSKVLQEIREAGYDQVILWVFAENDRARRFYQHHGFSETGESKRSWDCQELCYLRPL